MKTSSLAIATMIITLSVAVPASYAGLSDMAKKAGSGVAAVGNTLGKTADKAGKAASSLSTAPARATKAMTDGKTAVKSAWNS